MLCDEVLFDEWEGVELGYYCKFRVCVYILDGEEVVWVYVFDVYEGGLLLVYYLGEIVEVV